MIQAEFFLKEKNKKGNSNEITLKPTFFLTNMVIMTMTGGERKRLPGTIKD